jgi:hypothetical protein
VLQKAKPRAKPKCRRDVEHVGGRCSFPGDFRLSIGLFLMWCFDLIGFLNRRMKGKPKGKNGKSKIDHPKQVEELEF